ncbi:MAG TPA: hypothetical protein VMT93_05645 [Gemmatimonadaceae bacterium]|nr:hypothetical protein [Gemmatimonadaceae bacterium]
MSPLRRFVAINAFTGIAFGLVLVVAPRFLLSLYGIAGGTTTELFARMFGAELIGLNVPAWVARVKPEGEAVWFAVIGHAFAETLLLAISLSAALAGIGNAMIWSVVAIFALFSGGNLYFIFSKRVAVS